MNEFIENLADTLLWEVVSKEIENTIQAHDVLKDIDYINNEVVKKVERAEIFASEEFIIDSVLAQAGRYVITFQMPMILMFYDHMEQILRVTTTVLGSCCIADEYHFDWKAYDFDTMNRLELLTHQNLVENIRCSYQNIECDI